MTNIVIRDNRVERDVYIDFDIDTDVSYEQFCTKKEYKLLSDYFTDGSREAIGRTLMLLNGEEFVSKERLRKAIFLLSVDVKDVFFDKEQIMKSIFFLGEEEWIGKPFYNQEYNVKLDVYKYYTNDNCFLGEHPFTCNLPLFKQHEKDIKLFFPEISSIFTKKKRRKRKFQSMVVSNRRFEYVILQCLINSERIYLVTDQYFLDYKIVSASRLEKNVYQSGIVCNLSEIIQYVFEEKTIKQIEEIKGRHAKSKKLFENAMKDILEFINKVDSFNLRIEGKNKEVTYGKGEFKVQDVKRIEELRRYIGSQGGVYPTGEERQGKVLEGKKKFKRKKGGENIDKKK